MSDLVIALYGNDKWHFELRQFVADYLQAEMKFYRQFITTPPGPEIYLRNIRADKVWADDIELQTISEIYDCSIEIYSSSTKPIKVFNENPTAISMRVRLHYVGNCHYDVIWDTKRNTYPLQNQYFGEIERSSVQSAKERSKAPESSPNHCGDLTPSRASRLRFQKLYTKNIIEASNNSLSTLEKDFDWSTKQVMKEQESQMTEEEILKSVLAESMKDAYSAQKPSATNPKSQFTTRNPITGETRPRPAAPRQPDMALIIQLSSMGFSPAESARAISQLPTTATMSQIVDKIQDNRDLCLIYPKYF